MPGNHEPARRPLAIVCASRELGEDTGRPPGTVVPALLAEITLNATPGKLRAMAEFPRACADEMDRMGERFDHVHLSDRQRPLERRRASPVALANRAVARSNRHCSSDVKFDTKSSTIPALTNMGGRRGHAQKGVLMQRSRSVYGVDRRAVLAVLLVSAYGHALAVAADAPAATAAAQAEVEAIVARFVARARPVLPSIQAPKVVISFTPQLSWIEEDGSAIHTVEWSQCPQGMQGFFASLLGDAPSMAPPQFFHEVFNAFLVPHEMSHFVDAKRGRLKNGGDFYGGEVHANRVAVAFWLGEAGGRERMARLMDVVAQALGRLDTPVPPDADKATYFNEHYLALLDDASKYGWYQFRMFLDAWERRDEADFDALVRTPLA